MWTFNRIFGKIFDLLFIPFRNMNPWVGMAIISFLTGLLMLVIFRYTSNQAGIKKVYIVGNRVRDPEEKELITTFTQNNDLPLLDLIPYDDTVVKADRVGEAPLKYAKTSDSVKAIQQIGDKLLQERT